MVDAGRRWAKFFQRSIPMAIIALALAGCVTTPQGAPGLLIETSARGQPLAGASCVAMIDDIRWDVVTPAVIDLGDARGMLRIVCNQEGFRTSELIFKPQSMRSGTGISAAFGGGRSGGGFGFGIGFPLAGSMPLYPKRLVLELNPP